MPNRATRHLKDRLAKFRAKRSHGKAWKESSRHDQCQQPDNGDLHRRVAAMVGSLCGLSKRSIRPASVLYWLFRATQIASTATGQPLGTTHSKSPHEFWGAKDRGLPSRTGSTAARGCVVVGAGAAGRVVAARLSQMMPDARIVPVEAGGKRFGITTKAPALRSSSAPSRGTIGIFRQSRYRR